LICEILIFRQQKKHNKEDEKECIFEHPIKRPFYVTILKKNQKILIKYNDKQKQSIFYLLKDFVK
jgi:hypothetical protein